MGGKNNGERLKILIVDDTEVNRMILKDMLEQDYDILEAECGEQALGFLDELGEEIDLLLLDFIMPGMDGLEVLKEMNRCWWKADIPVIMISAENDRDFVVRAYKLGAVDYIGRPFDDVIVRHRVDGVMRMHRQEKFFYEIAAAQIMEKYHNNNMMMHILSGIVEFRNGESAAHILDVQILTDMLLRELVTVTDKYSLTSEDISMISTAAAIHDVGKISIPSSILNKPGHFTEEEFAIMKTHTVMGDEMLGQIKAYQDERLLKLCRQVCRWHHERYDGKGYPDGISGDDIPIAAQAVSLADVYDALTSERCYKKAYTHEKSMEMILNNECGVFNPLLLECLKNLGEDIPNRMASESEEHIYSGDIKRIIEETLRPRST